VKLPKHNQFRHAGPRTGISCLYQRLEFPHQVRDDALFELQHLIYHQIQRSYIELTLHYEEQSTLTLCRSRAAAGEKTKSYV